MNTTKNIVDSNNFHAGSNAKPVVKSDTCNNKKNIDSVERSISNKSNSVMEDQIIKNDKKETNENEAETVENESETVEVEEEDLPENFFDDFSNKDFMDGLDVLDDWIEEEVEAKKRMRFFNYELETTTKKTPDTSGKTSNKPEEKSLCVATEKDTRDCKNRSERDKNSNKEKVSERKRSRNRENEKRKRFRDYEHRRSRSRGRHEEKSRNYIARHPDSKSKENQNEYDSRRDPEKTKRDIERDKIRCAKDFETRVFKEQIKVAESGLVPPGTEMDVVLEREKQKQKNEQNVAKEKSLERKREKNHSKSHSHYSLDHELRKKYSPKRKHRDDSFSRYPKSRDKSISPRLHRRSRSVVRYHDVHEKRRDRHLKELSPISNISYSPTFHQDMNFRIKDSYDRFKNRRSCSPISSNSSIERISPKRKLAKRTSFMEEIEQKLREQQNLYSHSSIPQPVPPPQEFIPPTGFNPYYSFNDSLVPQFQFNAEVQQNMMPQMESFNNFNPTVLQPMEMVDSSAQMVQPIPENPVPVPVPVPTPQSSSHRNATNLKQCVSNSGQEVIKLFEEQMISLSDYLSVSAKDSTTPLINVHSKIRVISKCQDVIRLLKDESNFYGQFIPLPRPVELEKYQDLKWRSPLRKTVPIRFEFTTPTPLKKQHINTIFFKNLINKLLFVCNVFNDTAETFGGASAPVAPTINLKSERFKFTEIPECSPPIISRSTIGTQTEPVTCPDCDERAARKFREQHIQTVETEIKDQTTQVYMEDLVKSSVTFTPRGIMSSSLKSLSHLTPAQLLAQQESSSDNWSSRNDGFPIDRPDKDQYSSAGEFTLRNRNIPSNPIQNPNMNSSFRSSGSASSFPSARLTFADFVKASNRSNLSSGNSLNLFNNTSNRNMEMFSPQSPVKDNIPPSLTSLNRGSHPAWSNDPFQGVPSNRGCNDPFQGGLSNRGCNDPFQGGPSNRGCNDPFQGGPSNRGCGDLFQGGPLNRGCDLFQGGPANRGGNDSFQGGPNRGSNDPFQGGPSNRGCNDPFQGSPNRGFFFNDNFNSQNRPL